MLHAICQNEANPMAVQVLKGCKMRYFARKCALMEGLAKRSQLRAVMRSGGKGSRSRAGNGDEFDNEPRSVALGENEPFGAWQAHKTKPKHPLSSSLRAVRLFRGFE
jgi:hypothetical protein